jgi:hypothetical protein
MGKKFIWIMGNKYIGNQDNYKILSKRWFKFRNINIECAVSASDPVFKMR